VFKNSRAKKKELYVPETMDHCFEPDDLEAFILFPILRCGF
jgi:hypothetical protein